MEIYKAKLISMEFETQHEFTAKAGEYVILSKNLFNTLLNPTPIKTEQEYNKAISRFEQIKDADKNTPEGDELERLCLLLERYEEENRPLPNPVVEDELIHLVEQRGLDIHKAIKILKEYKTKK